MSEYKSEQFLKDHGVTTWGDFNNPPLPYKECNISEFWAKFNIWGVRGGEFRQVNLDGQNRNVHILIYHDAIFMIQVDWHYEKGISEYIPICYLVGCSHDFKHESTNRKCEHVATCKKCGYSYNYDSSD